ncbi:MAG: CRISPR-associated protein Cas4, partial [Halobacteriota archaeon]
VRAIAAAYALSWERETQIEQTLVEYPAYGVVRSVAVTPRRAATYRRVLRAVRSMDGPPPRVDDDRCSSCVYRDRCGVRTRSVASLLGF